MTASTRPSPARILEIATGHMAAKQLATASEAGIFRALKSGPLALDALAEATALDPRMTRILADAMVALGLLDRADRGGYGLTEESAEYLGAEGRDLSPYLAFLDDVSYPQWLRYAETIRTATPGSLDLSPERWEGFLAGVMTYNALHATMFAEQLEVTGTRSLDFGGLSPDFSIELMRRHPELTTTFLYAPDFAGAIAEGVDRAGLSDRSTVLEGATESAVPEGRFDLVLATHVIHRFDAATNRAIFTRLAGAAESGATLAVLDFFLDDEGGQRLPDALHAGEYFVIDGTVVYPLDEVRGWLRDAGWEPGALLELPGSPRVLLAARA